MQDEKKKKVDQGLSVCHGQYLHYYCSQCPYPMDIPTCVYNLHRDALALLKAQEPRLVEPTDFEKADDYNWLPAWCEERTGAGYWEMILPDALDEKDVRYWTGRPTDEKREAIPWQK